LKTANSLLSECQQPYQYLIESIRRRDDELSRLRQTLTARDADLKYEHHIDTDTTRCTQREQTSAEHGMTQIRLQFFE